jgi:predicted ATP-grasp superfamily ATP-dependent carboligase
LDIILQTAKQSGADIIIPVNRPTIRLLAEYHDEVEAIAALPPTPKPESMDIVSDKWLLAQYLQKENIPCPTTILYQKNVSDIQVLATLLFPVLVKPLDGEGGVGIEYFDELSKLVDYLERESVPDRLIIQSFINGYDIDCSVLCENGKILAYTIQKAFIAGKSRFAPADSIEFLHQNQVYDVIEELMQNLNWSGVAHVDLRFDEIENKPKIIEINPRYWGSLLGSLVAGINFPHLACLTSMKIDFPKPEYHFIRYTKPEVSIKLLIRKYLIGDATIRKFSETGLPYTMQDPFPEVQKEIARISKKMFRKQRSK